jgi:uncharacterized protein YecT (DUF1311 family)
MRGLAVVLCLWAGAAAAQKVDCVNPLVQQDMNYCAAEEYREADAELNATWRDAIAWAEEVGLEDDLRTAQRAWITFRDAACAVETAVWEGGSMAPLIHATCMTRLTRARTTDLGLVAEN